MDILIFPRKNLMFQHLLLQVVFQYGNFHSLLIFMMIIGFAPPMTVWECDNNLQPCI